MFKLDKRIGDRSLSQSSFKKEYATGFSVQKHKVICGWNNKITSLKYLFLKKTVKTEKKKKDLGLFMVFVVISMAGVLQWILTVKERKYYSAESRKETKMPPYKVMFHCHLEYFIQLWSM